MVKEFNFQTKLHLYVCQVTIVLKSQAQNVLSVDGEKQMVSLLFTTALALRSRGLVIGSREEKEREEKEEKEEKEREEEEEEKNLQIAIRCLWDLFD